MNTSKMIRVSEHTIEALRLATSEIATTNQQWMRSDDERIRALIDHWKRTKANGTQSPKSKRTA